MGHVVEVTRSQLEARRAAILSSLGGDTTLEDLRRRAEEASLAGDEWDAWQQICDIEFLLGDG
jgi:hypothetical protein